MYYDYYFSWKHFYQYEGSVLGRFLYFSGSVNTENKVLSPLNVYGVNLISSFCGFTKNITSNQKVKPWFFVTFDIIIIHIFPDSFIEIPEIVQKIRRISLSILAIFVNFHQLFNFLIFSWYKETNDVSLNTWCQRFTFNVL